MWILGNDPILLKGLEILQQFLMQQQSKNSVTVKLTAKNGSCY
jgi:hypothetical protein